MHPRRGVPAPRERNFGPKARPALGIRLAAIDNLAITQMAKKLDILALARIVGHRDLRRLYAYYKERAEDIATRLG